MISCTLFPCVCMRHSFASCKNCSCPFCFCAVVFFCCLLWCLITDTPESRDVWTKNLDVLQLLFFNHPISVWTQQGFNKSKWNWINASLRHSASGSFFTRLLPCPLSATKRYLLLSLPLQPTRLYKAGSSSRGLLYVSDGYDGRRHGRGRQSPDYFEESESDDLTRVFVALFDYDPLSMSPNPDAADEELPFKEGQVIKVI